MFSLPRTMFFWLSSIYLYFYFILFFLVCLCEIMYFCTNLGEMNGAIIYILLNIRGIIYDREKLCAIEFASLLYLLAAAARTSTVCKMNLMASEFSHPPIHPPSSVKFIFLKLDLKAKTTDFLKVPRTVILLNINFIING